MKEAKWSRPWSSDCVFRYRLITGSVVGVKSRQSIDLFGKQVGHSVKTVLGYRARDVPSAQGRPLNVSPLTRDSARGKAPRGAGMRSLGAKASTALPCAASALFVATFPLYHAVGQANGRAGVFCFRRANPLRNGNQSACHLSENRDGRVP